MKIYLSDETIICCWFIQQHISQQKCAKISLANKVCTKMEKWKTYNILLTPCVWLTVKTTFIIWFIHDTLTTTSNQEPFLQDFLKIHEEILLSATHAFGRFRSSTTLNWVEKGLN